MHGGTAKERAKSFYRDLIDTFTYGYPALRENQVKLVKVLHAFEDKVPLVEVLLEKDLLCGVLLKKSSSELQPSIVRTLEELLRENNLLITRSKTTYASSIPDLADRSKGHAVIIGDHGGYFSHMIPAITAAFGDKLIGMTEHTLNGEEKIHHHKDIAQFHLPYLSTARIDLKERSDRDIAASIMHEIIRASEWLGKPIFSKNGAPIILLAGYGMMGFHAAQTLKQIGCPAELVITDISYKKRAFAVQDGFAIAHNLESVLPHADIVMLATNVIKGEPPALTPYHFSLLKEGACITSMTSMDDEAAQDEMIAQGFITPKGKEGLHGIYKGPTGKDFMLFLNGRPANAEMPDGGTGAAIYMVQAAGLAGDFLLADHVLKKKTSPLPAQLPDDIAEEISRLWLRHFADIRYQDINAYSTQTLL
jgi:S-adenosylhomocysteine hydrolase